MQAYIVFNRSSLDQFFLVWAKSETEVWGKLNDRADLVKKYGLFTLGEDGDDWDLIEPLGEVK